MELQAVAITLQSEVIRALQIARDQENVLLNLSMLHDASITNRNNAIRSMDELCQRIIQSFPVPRQLAEDNMQAFMAQSGGFGFPFARTRRNSEESLESYQTASPALPSAVTIPDHPGSSRSPIISRFQSMRHASDSLVHRATSLVPSRTPGLPACPEPASRRRQHDSIAAFDMFDRVATLSVHDSGRGSVETNSGHRQSASLSSQAVSEELPAPDSNTARSRTTPGVVIERRADLTSSTASTASHHFPDQDTEAQSTSMSAIEAHRALSAPEVVTHEFSPRLMHNPTRPRQQTPNTITTDFQPSISNAFLGSPIPMTPVHEDIWHPLPRPAKINNYHGFCKGAWQTRHAVQEGLSISLLQVPGRHEPVPHWKCKHCSFQARALNESTVVLPEQIFFAKSGVRYRWLFLARSHIPARDPRPTVEEYGYGCIFCAAQGHETAVHEGLDALMNHLLSRHKTSMLTPEVLAKTKCIVGGTPDKVQEWDINLPAAKAHSVGGMVGEFVVSAVTGLSSAKS
ncbi:hypothetical protein KC343_g12086 [Hortaea werneckii]|nr:hypothetical protein KC338_g386 [Hortaea werneckii]KAI7187695.1 hypothetical protein KC352_g22186 [Hortaea werneckii]KAI7553237.1 hypothetical protein KC317_g13549 [Hortaea werneckii]KAI7597923.1 hypothetical protein KC346_g14469 [Hortaea werneckii]KAI7610032.1 hypothetical protein KC343_g12086 [Hortaea werneckii]